MGNARIHETRRAENRLRLCAVGLLAIVLLVPPSGMLPIQQAFGTPGAECDPYTPCDTGEDCCDGECYNTTTHCCVDGDIAPRYDTLFPIAGQVQSVDGEKWAHINDGSESCDLEIVNAEDLDIEDCSVRDNYQGADWDGGTKGYCVPDSNSDTTSWYATGTGNSTVTATLKDDDNNPETDDVDLELTFNEVNGFMVKVEVYVSGAFQNGPYTVTEGETLTAWQHGFWSSWAEVGHGTPGAEQVDDANWVNIQLDFKTTPSDAAPRRNIQAQPEYRTRSYYEWEVSDGDIYDEDGDSVYCGVAIPLSRGFQATFQWGWDLEDEEEGLVQCDWAYNADGVGANRASAYPSAPWREYESGQFWESELPKSDTETLTWSETIKNCGAGYLSRQKGATVISTYTLGLGVKAVGSSTSAWAKGRVKFSSTHSDIRLVQYAAAQ